MLNIQKRISLCKKSKRIIKKFWKKKQGVMDSNSWGGIDKSIKNEISTKLLNNQEFKCVYCERYLIGLGHEIDHFAHKADNPNYTFNPTNLFYSCRFCNSSSRKGQKNVVMAHSNFYNRCVFNIVHPYFNDVNAEIIFKDQDRIDYDWDNCTELGKNTITFFGFDDPIMTNIRARQLVFERLNPLTSDQQVLLIKASIAYK